jgi:hypothetical protein
MKSVVILGEVCGAQSISWNGATYCVLLGAPGEYFFWYILGILTRRRPRATCAWWAIAARHNIVHGECAWRGVVVEAHSTAGESSDNHLERRSTWRTAGRMVCRYHRPGVYLLICSYFLEGKVRVLRLNNSMLSLQLLWMLWAVETVSDYGIKVLMLSHEPPP